MNTNDFVTTFAFYFLSARHSVHPPQCCYGGRVRAVVFVRTSGGQRTARPTNIQSENPNGVTIQSSARSPAGAILTIRGKNFARGSTRSVCAAMTSSMFL